MESLSIRVSIKEGYNIWEWKNEESGIDFDMVVEDGYPSYSRDALMKKAIPHIDMNKKEHSHYQKLFLNVNSVEINEYNTIKGFEINLEFYDTHISSKTFEAEYLVIHDRSSDEYFFIRHAKGYLTKVYCESDSSSCEFNRSFAYVTLNFPGSYNWREHDVQNSMSFMTQENFFRGPIRIAEYREEERPHPDHDGYIMKDWQPNMVRDIWIGGGRAGRAGHELPDQKEWLGFANHETNYEKDDSDTFGLKWVVGSSSHNSLDYIIQHEWSKVTPIGVKIPTVYRHKDGKTVARSEEDLIEKSKRIQEKRINITIRNLKNLDTYMKLRPKRKKNYRSAS